MISKMFALFIILLSMSAFGEDYIIMNKIYKFEFFQRVLISNCSKNCEAKKELKRFQKKDLLKMTPNKSYQNSPGSEVCTKVFKGESLLGQAINRDKRAFCVFKDESLIEINSLTNMILGVK